MHEFTVQTPAREVLVDITAAVEGALAKLGAQGHGLAWVFVPHTTAGITLNEGADPSVARDLVAFDGPRSRRVWVDVISRSDTTR